MKQFTKVVLMALCAIIIAHKSHAGTIIYMKIMRTSSVQITGESVAKGYVGDVEITSESQGSSVTLNTTSGTPAPGKININDFSFQTNLSSVSLPLLTLMYEGTKLYSVDLYFVNSGCNCAYYRVHMENVFITTISEAGSSDGVNQQFTFSPNQIAWAYYQQATNGSIPSSPTNQFAWDKVRDVAWTYRF